jgi:hypothetical protein
VSTPEASPLTKPWRRIPFQTTLTAIIPTVLGLALIIQSGRWLRTPAYGNLLRIMPADTWGAIYLIVAALLIGGIVYRKYHALGIAGHTAGFVLLAVWEVGFIIRWITDHNTTIANVLSWGIFLSLLVWSAKTAARRPSP